MAADTPNVHGMAAEEDHGGISVVSTVRDDRDGDGLGSPLLPGFALALSELFGG